MMKKYKLPVVMFITFELVAIILWILLNNIFYLFNFSYIGCIIAFGMLLSIKKYKYSRIIVQFGVGIYMFLYLGIISNENMNMEGFWYYLFSGVFQAAVIHYVIAKILGPFIFGRGWCGYACWSAMIFDLLPYKIPKMPRKRRLGFIHYIIFTIILVFIIAIFKLNLSNVEKVMFWSFVLVNLFYYVVGTIIAVYFRDNRAFCKYICPITIFLKPASYFSILRVKVDTERCILCGKCKKICPMNVDVTDNRRSRENGTECILCTECVKVCPKNAVKL